MGIWNRRGRGSNQYTVKPSPLNDDSEVSDRVANMADRHGVPSSSESDQGSPDSWLESSLRQLRASDRSGDTQQSDRIRQDISRSYPESYAREVVQADKSNEVYQDAVGNDDMGVDELAETLEATEWQGDEQADSVDRSDHELQSRMSSLVMVSRKDSGAMSAHYQDIDQTRSKMASQRVNNMAF